jgi:RHS repeat-associated protein
MTQIIFGFIACLFFFQHANAAQTSISEIYLGSREGDPASLVENVSTIHGDYTEVEVDVTVASPDSLVLSRFYSSRDTLPIATFGGWRFNPQCFLTMQKDPKGKTYSTAEGKFERTFVYLGNPDGSILTYVGWRNITNANKRVLFKVDAEMECAGIANTARGDVGAWTNLKNNELYYNPQNDTFELSLCTEGKRFYIKNQAGNFYSITHEILPSGNKIFYEFNNKNQLELIKETNASEKKVLAWIKINYGKTIHLETSDGKTVDYQFQQDPSGAQLLVSVARSDKPNLHYQYQVIDDHALLVKKTLPEGRFVHVDYYTDKANKHKVKNVTTPAGSGGTSTIHFAYDQDSTEVDGPGPRKAVYRFDENLQLVAIEQYLDGSLYRVHKKSWGRKSDAGNLIFTSLADASGNIFYHKYLIYDRMDKGNIIEEREYGDIAGTGPLALAVDDEGLVGNQDGSIKNFSYFIGKNTHGFFQRDAKGTGVKYWYKKGTNLLVKKLVLTKGSIDSEDEDYNSGIRQRFFYTYNDDAALTKVIVDDGREGDQKNFYSVKERMITCISPKQEMPNVGAPEVIEQKYSTTDGKSEFLIKRTVNHFDGQGNVSKQEIHDANGEHRYTINKRYVHGLLISETDPLGNETQYSYDGNQNLASEASSDTGMSIEYGYDLRNRLIHTIERDRKGNQFETELVYDAAGYKCCEKDRFGNLTIYENDSLGRPVRITYPDTSNGLHASLSPTYIYEYDLFDNPICVTDPNGRVLKKTYNLKGKPSQIEYLDGTKDIFRYDSGGNIHHHYCRNGTIDVFEYDYIGRPSKIEYFRKGDNPSKGYSFKNAVCEYSTFHKTSETDFRGKKTTYTYNGCGRLASLKKENQKVDFTYDSLGRTQSVKKWKSAKDFTLEVRDYDLLDRVVEERTESSSGQVLLHKKFVYNDAGELAQIIGYPQGKESVLMQYDYDGFGRIIKATNAVGSSTQVIYDDAYVNSWGQKGSKRTVIDPIGNSTEEIFDNDEHLIQVCKKDKAGKLLSCIDTAYDSAGNKVLEKAVVISTNGQSGDFAIEYSYTPGDQLETITVGKGSPEERVTRFEYNTYGELTKKFYPGAQTPILYQYDNRGDLEKVSYKEGKNDVEYKMYYDYNKNLTSMSRDNLSLYYSYDENELLTEEKVKDDFGSYQVTRAYDGEGKVKTLKFPDGSYVEYSYEGPLVKSVSRFDKNNKEIYTYAVASRDTMGNITEEILPGHLGARIQALDEAGRRVGIATDFFKDKVLGYDALDNIKKRETALEEEPFTTEYDYNALLQLISEKGEAEHNYSYDSIGNRLKKDNSLYKVNALNELIEAEGCIYTCHPNGNVATKVVDGKTWTYQSNPLNQIVSIKDDQITVNYTYDLTGKRFSKRLISKTKKRIQRFFYIDDTEIGCLDEKGEIVELKIPSNPNNPESPAIAIEIKKEIYVPFYDLQGNIACLLDHNRRRVVESYRYSAYGEEEILNDRGRTVSDSSVGNPWRFKGKRVDKEVGLIYFGYRYYDPQIGRWISPDPMGTIDGPNMYAFVRNNPIKYVDYFGFNSQLDPNCGCTQHGHPGWHNAPPGCVCICGRDGRSEAPANSYRSKMGSDIKSVLGGIGHGVVDFMVGSLHDLQTAAVYIGSAELEMSLHERINMIEAVEQSQMRQMDAVGSRIMGMMAMDESNALYQSFRSKTTMGLEIGSLVAGGYGAVKGVIGFSKLARMPVQVTKISKNISRLPSNPLHGTRYSKKVLLQMEKNLKTGQPDFHGFPKIVDNYANLGQRELIKGKDGLIRTKINLDGGYKGLDGHFEWIIEADSSVNHRLFVPNH